MNYAAAQPSVFVPPAVTDTTNPQQSMTTDPYSANQNTAASTTLTNQQPTDFYNNSTQPTGQWDASGQPLGTTTDPYNIQQQTTDHPTQTTMGQHPQWDQSQQQNNYDGSYLGYAPGYSGMI